MLYGFNKQLRNTLKDQIEGYINKSTYEEHLTPWLFHVVMGLHTYI